MLQKLHEIEEKFDRQRVSRWSARTLDLDLLALEAQVLPSKEIFQEWYNLPLSEQREKIPSELIVPHPRIQEREFVLLPLLDIQPNWTHPILNKTVLQLCEELPEKIKKNIKIVQLILVFKVTSFYTLVINEKTPGDSHGTGYCRRLCR